MLSINAQLSTVDNYQHILSFDPALDIDSDEHKIDRYLETGDEQFMPMKAGEQATVFTLRHLTGEVRRKLKDLIRSGGQDKSRMHQFFFEAAKYALVSIVNPDVEVKQGKDGDGHPHAEPELLERLYSQDNAIVEDLGLRVFHEDFQPPKKS